MIRTSVIYFNVNSLVLTLERTQFATLLLALDRNAQGAQVCKANLMSRIKVFASIFYLHPYPLSDRRLPYERMIPLSKLNENYPNTTITEQWVRVVFLLNT